ncbi:growth-regulating factor 9-like [Malania oleifera]|uniref:growth-regulating factor 9-like n=1 Tax=Malania oleifera TaxID=397392 RepID=UPI0025ADEFDF|nr:growth-regulating factor 9-like [Malania oleifera]
MDPEAGRCRRTDGKKWRCSKGVVLGQKYCERHMHRGRGQGRKRSIKPVEASEVASPSAGIMATINNSNADNSNSNVSISVSSILQLNTFSSNRTSHKDTITGTRSKYNESCNNLIMSTAAAASTAITVAPAMTTMATTNNSSKRKKAFSKDYFDGNSIILGHGVDRSSSNGSSTNIVGRKLSTKLRFSPKSVLQDSIAVGCSSLCFDYRSNTESEPWRCRRTDGKKWRCSRDAIAHQRYCAQHMHRGAKKHKES